MATDSVAISKDVGATSFWQGAVVVLGRFFFALIFLFAAPNHFTRQTIAFSASQGRGLGFDRGSAFRCGGHRRRPQHFAGLSRKTWRLAHRAVPDSGHLDVAQVLGRFRTR